MTDRVLTAAHLARLLDGWQTGRPAYAALAARLRLLMRDGRLPIRSRLPAERELAAALGASRTTVGAAYQLLRDEGYLLSRQGSGSWVRPPAGGIPTPQPIGPPYGDPAPDTIDLVQAALPAPVALTGAVDAAVRDLPAHLDSTGYQPLGLAVLRQQIAEHYLRRGLPTTADQVLVTSGAGHALAMAVDLLTGPGDRMLVETPTYPNAIVCATRANVRPVGVVLGDDGWDLDMMEATVRQSAPRLAYLMPDFHNPTGQLLSDAGRRRLAGILQATRTVTLVDESAVLLGLDAEPPPPLAAYDGAVLSTGSLSKVGWGGLRVGWLRGPAELVQRLAARRLSVDGAGPVLDQLVAAHLLASADDVIADRRRTLTAQRDTLAGALRESLPQWTFRLPGGGLSLWLDLGGPHSTTLTLAVERHGLRLAPGPRFGPDGTAAALEHRLRIPYVHPQPVLLEAVRRLADAAADVDRSPRRAPALTATPI